MLKKRLYGVKVILNSPIPSPSFVQRITFGRRKATLSYDFPKIQELHPRMKPENYHEGILKKVLAGNQKEAQCVSFSGDPTVLAKLIGVAAATAIMKAQEAKVSERGPGFAARAAEGLRNMFAHGATQESEEPKTSSTEGKEEPDLAGATA